MTETKQQLFTAGDCPVCSSAGVLALLMSRADNSVLYVCPMCGVAWTTPPPPHTVDKIVPIEDAAPEGLRFPTGNEVDVVRLRGVNLTEIDVEDWLDDLARYLAAPQ